MTNAPLTQSTRTLLGNLQLVNSRNSETLNSVKSRNKFSSFGAFTLQLPYSNIISPWLTEFGPLPWQAKQTTSALCQLQPATQAGQILLNLAKFC